MVFKKEPMDRYRSYGFEMRDWDNLDWNKNRFHAIYFIDYLTGSLLLGNKYSNQSKICEANEDLISSFLNAINLFINELNQNDDDEEEIREINFRDSRILYERRDRLMVIGISKKTNLVIERTILQNLLNDFYERFEYKITHFNGVIDQEILGYKKFLNNLDHYIFSHDEFNI